MCQDKQKDIVVEMKQPTTYGQQVELIKKKGFCIEDDDECIEFLHQANYYRLMAYLLPFKKRDGSYVKGIDFNRIKRIYEFDGRLRSLLFQSIEEIELYLRTQFSYYSAHKYGTLGYMDKNNYSERLEAESFFRHVDSCIEDHKKTMVVKHHKEKYGGQFPIWVVIEFFSIGMMSYYYAGMKTEDQKALAKDLYAANPALLKSWMRCLTDLRNQCAHYSRLYAWVFSAIPKMPRECSFVSDRKLFSQIMMIKFLYPNKQKWNSKPLNELKALIEEHGEDISLRHIGFPENWEELLKN